LKLDVKVKRVLWPAPEKEGTRFLLLTSKGKAIGNMRWRPNVGDMITLDGIWGARDGERQFQFKGATPNVPDDPRMLLNYVCSKAHGIGPKIEEAIWNRYGSDWRSAEAGGFRDFSRAKYNAFVEALEQVDGEAAKTSVMVWLIDKGATENMAAAAYDEWKSRTQVKVLANPFALAELPNYGFQNVDVSIRQNFGIEDRDPRRIKAAIFYKLRQITNNGDTVVDWDELEKGMIELLGLDLIGDVCDAVRDMMEEGKLIGFQEAQRLAMASDYHDEIAILEFATA